MATARLNLRIDSEIKKRGERAGVVEGYPSFTAYVANLIDKDSKKVLLECQRITLSNDAFDRFIEASRNPPKPNKALREALQFTREQGMVI